MYLVLKGEDSDTGVPEPRLTLTRLGIPTSSTFQGLRGLQLGDPPSRFDYSLVGVYLGASKTPVSLPVPSSRVYATL